MAAAFNEFKETYKNLEEKYDEIKNFLILNNKRFRRFFHKKYLKNIFK